MRQYNILKSALLQELYAYQITEISHLECDR